jgi:hypothetical protein
MALIRGPSDKTRSRNIAQLRREGYPQHKAAAIAYRIQREERAKRRAKNNPINPVGWTVLILGGAAVVGVGVYLATRPAAAATNKSAAPPPPPGGPLTMTDMTPHLPSPPKPAFQRTIYVPPPFIFGKEGPTPYNPNNKDLGNPYDPNSPAYACVQAYNMIHGGPLNTRELYAAKVWADACVKAGGRANW